MRANVAVLPSNQHQNIASGDPNPSPGSTTEEQIQHDSGIEAVAELLRQGANAKMFYVPGAGSASTDELRVMCDQALAWLNGYSTGSRYSLSLHSDVGGTNIIFPQLCQQADMAWGTAMGKDLAARVGMGFKTPWVRTGSVSIMWASSFRGLGVNRAILMEVGEHGGSTSAAHLWKYRRFDGLMAARAFLKGCGYAVNDGPVPADVVVPVGLEKWKGSTVPTPTPTPGPAPPPTPPPTPPPILRTGVDYSQNSHSNWPAFFAALKATGRDFIGRYIPIAGGSKPPVTVGELTAAAQAGIDAWLIFERNIGSKSPYGGFNQGIIDATAAVAGLAALGIPATQPVYYSCDGVVGWDAETLVKVDGYFDGIRSKVGLNAIGVYGSHHLIDHLSKAGKCKYFCQGFWFHDAPADALHPAANLSQRTNTIVISGITCDQDKAYKPFGQYRRGVTPGPTPTVKTIRPDTTKPLLKMAAPHMTGTHVTQMQTLLLARGFKLPKYGADGDFGNETLTAFLAFQQSILIEIQAGRMKLSDPAARWTADGICGKWSWGALGMS